MMLLKNADSGVYPLNETDIQSVQQQAGQLGYRCWLVSCAQAHSKSQVLSCIAKTLGFSAHFGGNFDALSDCLTDMTSGAGHGIVIILDQLPVAPQFSQQDQEVLLDVFRDSLAYFKEQKIPYFIFYQFNH